MKRIKIPTMIMVMIMAFAAMLTSGSQKLPISTVYCQEESPDDKEETEQEISSAFELINQMRESVGLEVFGWSKRLASDAKTRAMEASRLFSHTRPDGSKWYEVDSEHVYGENLACNYFNYNELILAWMRNPAHFANLTSAFRIVGISVYYTDAGECFWAMELGY